MKIKEVGRSIKRSPQLYIMISLVVVWVIVFKYIPYYGLTIAFKKFNLIGGFWTGDWVGLKNFKNVFRDPYLLRNVRNTFLLGGYTLLVTFPAAIIFSLFLNEITSTKYKRIVQSLTYLPHFVSTVIVVGLLYQLFGYDGLITEGIWKLTGIRYDFMGSASSTWFRTMYVGSELWRGLGWSTIIFLATISGISPSLYEAAMVEGANRFQSLWHITLPCLLPTISILLILNVGKIIDVSFEKVLLMQSSLNLETSDVISTYVYRRGLLKADYSYGTAVGLLNGIVSIAMVLGTNKIAKSISGSGLW